MRNADNRHRFPHSAFRIQVVLPTRSPPAVPLWLYWILLGLVAGTLAKFLVPGRDPSGCIITIALGIAGAFIGGWLGTFFGWGRITQGTLNLRSVGIATVGAAVLLVVGRLLAKRRSR
jgi:uncharacterized membrane protein YeaQ/YmgE (transglycosylase-associated protein family)